MNHFYNFLQTTIHKFWVLAYLFRVCYCLIKRGLVHDMSKYSKYEAPFFASNIFKLKHATYGSPEYAKILSEITPALEHHYKTNSHHPQYWPNGISDMSPLDEIEMLVDWRAATRRMKSGNIQSSIIQNSKRFSYFYEKQQAYLRAIKEVFPKETHETD